MATATPPTADTPIWLSASTQVGGGAASCHSHTRRRGDRGDGTPASQTPTAMDVGRVPRGSGDDSGGMWHLEPTHRPLPEYHHPRSFPDPAGGRVGAGSLGRDYHLLRQPASACPTPGREPDALLGGT